MLPPAPTDERLSQTADHFFGVRPIIEKISAPCWQSAISTYYYTSAHSIVIAALVALGTLFIVYRGSTDTEDVLLTLAGVCTLIAAMVPELPRPVRAVPGKLICRTTTTSRLPCCPMSGRSPSHWVWAMGAMLLVQWRRGDTRHPRTAMGMLLSRFVFLADYGGRPDYPHVLSGQVQGVGTRRSRVLMLAAFIATAFCTAYIVGREDVKIAPHRRFFQVLYGDRPCRCWGR